MTDVDEFPSEELFRDKQAEIMRAKEAIAGPTPIIPDAPDPVLALPRGLFYEGAWKRKVILKELTGQDEEALAKTRDPNDFFDIVVALGVERLGDLEMDEFPQGERVAMFQQLLIGERDQIFLGVLRATFGDERTLGYTCSLCGSKQELILSLTDDFKAKTVDGLDTAMFTQTTSKGEEISYRLATGADQADALSKKGATQAEQNSIVLSRVILAVDGKDVLDPMAYVRRMSMRDRQSLLADLVDKQPSVDLEVTTDCSSCGGVQTLSLGWADLFRAR